MREILTEIKWLIFVVRFRKKILGIFLQQILTFLIDNCPSRANAGQHPFDALITTCCLRGRWEFEGSEFLSDTSGWGNHMQSAGIVSQVAGKNGKSAISLNSSVSSLFESSAETPKGYPSLEFDGTGAVSMWYKIIPNNQTRIYSLNVASCYSCTSMCYFCTHFL